ncbi:glutathione S-transferase family protein [Pseudomonas indica]|uniref:glutathione S-transferase family protein n=1 Tax=Pseudomonas indica TaxID=137658 RepID=UPI0023FA3493|nr:glutathione S-transferase family protein [Pseudomonas indica]MBU3055305.1 glutathione S-transferase family protein [Pseudomonas indica]
MRLYDFHLSGNCYKVRLFLSLIGQEAEQVELNLRGGEQKTPEFLAINPRGQVPALEDGDFRIGDSQAILVYLAARYAPAWAPADPLTQARIASWLSFAANEMQNGPAMARVGKLFGYPIDEAKIHAKAIQALELLDAQLARHPWLAQTDAPSIADLAVYPYAALAGDGGLDLAPYTHLNAWFTRLQALPGYIGMTGL